MSSPFAFWFLWCRTITDFITALCYQKAYKKIIFISFSFFSFSFPSGVRWVNLASMALPHQVCFWVCLVMKGCLMAEMFFNWFGSQTLNFQGQFTASFTFSTPTKAIILIAAQPHPSPLPTPPAKSELHSTLKNPAVRSSSATTRERDWLRELLYFA